MDKDQLETEYRSLNTNINHFSEEISRQIVGLLEYHKVSLAVPIEKRVKSWASIAEKLERKLLVLDNITSLHDLIGLRLILLFQRDVEITTSILSSTFKVISQENTLKRLKESQFGYGSIHFVIELPLEWLAVPTMSQLSGLRAEVQVRTASQHIWAAASHLLQYKQEAAVPSPVKRAIHRVSALLETVDLEFERVLQERESYKRSASIDASAEELNVDSLAKILDEMLPPENKMTSPDESYADLLLNFQDSSILTQRQLTEMIREHLDYALSEDKNAVLSFGRPPDPGPLVFVPADGHSTAATVTEEMREKTRRWETGVHFNHVGLVRQMLDKETGRAWRDALKERSAPAKRDTAT